MTTRAVFHADPELLARASVGAALRITGEEARHAATVRRLRSGEEIDLVDGAGLRVTVAVTAASKEALAVSTLAVDHEKAPVPRLVLVQALAKGGRDEQAIESATELGVDGVLPWQAERSVSVWSGGKGGSGKGDGGKAEKGMRRWQALVHAAAKQSRRAFVPEVLPFMDTAGLAAFTRELVDAGGAVLVLHESAEISLLHDEVLPGAHETGGRDVEAGEVEAGARLAVVVGPEGGIADGELDRLAAAGARVVRAGPHVMRSSTAGPAALAVLAARLGRWDGAGNVGQGISPVAPATRSNVRPL